MHTFKKIKGKAVSISGGYNDYFHLEIYDRDGTFLGYRERKEVIERELEECGYFVIVTSRRMSARDTLELYKSRDVSEKMFRGDKSYLGNKSLRVHTDERAAAKIFIEFVALIIRCRIYMLLQREKERLDKEPNFMTVPAAIKELEKIEIVKGLDGRYRMDHASRMGVPGDIFFRKPPGREREKLSRHGIYDCLKNLVPESVTR